MLIFENPLPAVKLELAKQKDQLMVRCLVRNKWLKLTPEEWVRQHVIHFLVHEIGYSIQRIALEVQVKSMGQNRRSDIVVYSPHFTPMLVVECKAPEVQISAKTLIQMGNYVNKMNSTFAWMTNGTQHGLIELNEEGQIEHKDLKVLYVEKQ